LRIRAKRKGLRVVERVALGRGGGIRRVGARTKTKRATSSLEKLSDRIDYKKKNWKNG